MCLLIISTHNSWQSSKIKYLSDLYLEKLATTPDISIISFPSLNLPNKIESPRNRRSLYKTENHNHISCWYCSLICFKLVHQSYTDWEIKYVCCASIILNFSYRCTISKCGLPKSTLTKYLWKIYPRF